MTTYADKTGFAKPADGSKVWGPEYRAFIDYLSQVLSARNEFHVSPDFTTANLGNGSAVDRRMFPTIQEAINACTATGLAQPNTIIVHPGTYPENLSITKSVHICGKVPPFYRAWAGSGNGGCAAICGGAGAQAPVITVTPPESDFVIAQLNNLVLWNQYNATAGQIANAYLLKVAGQTVYGALQNYIGMQGCDIRAQTWGPNNDWQHGILCSGWVNFNARRVHYTSFRYAGGNNNGGINSHLTLNGNNAGAKACTARLVDCALTQQYGGAYASPALFKLDNLANVTVALTPMYRDTGAYVVVGATGANTHSGIGTDLVNGTPAVAAAYGNLLGVDLAGM